MADKKTFEIKDNVSITDEVVAVVAGLAATEVDGVDALNGNIKNADIARTGQGKLSKGVRIKSKGENSISVKLALIIRYGFEIPTICGKVQDKVKSAIENMTGLLVDAVDIQISTVVMD